MRTFLAERMRDLRLIQKFKFRFLIKSNDQIYFSCGSNSEDEIRSYYFQIIPKQERRLAPMAIIIKFLNPIYRFQGGKYKGTSPFAYFKEAPSLRINT